MLGVSNQSSIANNFRTSTLFPEPFNISDQDGRRETEIPLFDLSTMNGATDNFSIQNKLGEGGFGPVYKVLRVCLGLLMIVKQSLIGW